MKDKYYIYGTSGGIDNVKKRVINCNNFYINDILEFIRNIKYCNATLTYYGYDQRIQRQVYKITADHSKLKQQFLHYVIQD
jgi:hypothetical protein